MTVGDLGRRHKGRHGKGLPLGVGSVHKVQLANLGERMIVANLATIIGHARSLENSGLSQNAMSLPVDTGFPSKGFPDSSS